jgi:Histidyl-tRNA synthetase
MRDILPSETELRDASLARILAVYRSYGFERIETPALESLDRLRGGEGGENEKLIFKVLKRGEALDLNKLPLLEDDLADLGLRFDLTVPSPATTRTISITFRSRSKRFRSAPSGAPKGPKKAVSASSLSAILT